MVTIKRIAITKVNTIVKYVLFAKIVLSCEFTFLLGWLTGPIIRIKMAQNAYSTRRISEISTLLFDACVNKESLDIDVISEDCREIISMLLDNDLIEIKEV